jgi:hypothetical protein
MKIFHCLSLAVYNRRHDGKKENIIVYISKKNSTETDIMIQSNKSLKNRYKSF